MQISVSQCSCQEVATLNEAGGDPRRNTDAGGLLTTSMQKTSEEGCTAMSSLLCDTSRVLGRQGQADLLKPLPTCGAMLLRPKVSSIVSAVSL